jgi:hypothetical protein
VGVVDACHLFAEKLSEIIQVAEIRPDKIRGVLWRQDQPCRRKVRRHRVLFAQRCSRTRIRWSSPAARGGATYFGYGIGKTLIESRAVVSLGSGDPIGWTATMHEIISDAETWSFAVTAICGTAPGLEYVPAGLAPTNSTPARVVTRTCPAGKVALSGGFTIGGAASTIALYGSYPYDGLGLGIPLGWTFRAFGVISSENNWSLLGT